MPITACPFCFSKIDSSSLGYLCSGEGNVRCRKEVDQKRAEITGNATPMGRYFEVTEKHKGDATCPECQASTKRRACTVCHTVLAIEYVGTKNPMLGMVGSKGAGKTVLMTVMIERLRKVIAPRFHADISIAADNPSGMTSITAFMRDRVQDLYQGGNLPQGTRAFEENGRVPVVVRWRADKKSTMLAFLDSAGEDFASEESTSGLRYLAACEYLIVAFDPFSLPGARDQLSLPQQAIQSEDDASILALHQITTKLRTNQGKAKKKIKVPVAIAFTKIDAFSRQLEDGNAIMEPAPRLPSYDEGDGLAVHERMKALLEDWNAGDIERHMGQFYEDYRYFGVSALGAPPDYSRGQVAPGGVRPHRVEDPILWLMSKAKMVKTVKP